MNILGMENVSFVDYEGYMCSTIFTGGCNFMCPFCHNAGIVHLNPKPIDEEEVLTYLQGRTKLLDAVTISGGEPTLQRDLKEFIKKVKNLGYKVKLDTNGTAPQVIKDLIEEKLIDFVAMDIKTSFNDYPRVSGVNFNYQDKVKETLNILKQSNIDYELRTTLVSEFHNEKVIEEMKQDLKDSKRLYLQKFVDNGTCIKTGLNAVDKNTAVKYLNLLSQTIDEVKLRGYN